MITQQKDPPGEGIAPENVEPQNAAGDPLLCGQEDDKPTSNKRKEAPEHLHLPARIEPSPTKQKTGQQNVADYCVKKLSATEYLRKIPPTCNPKNFLVASPVQVTIRDVGHGLWTCFQIDAFGSNREPKNIDPLYHVLGYDNRTKEKRNKNDKDTAAMLNVLCACKRRKSKENGATLFRPPSGAANSKLKPESLFFLNWYSRSKEKKETTCRQVVDVSLICTGVPLYTRLLLTTFLPVSPSKWDQRSLSKKL